MASGAETFAADQVIYDATSADGNLTVYAGTVSQGSGTFDVSAARIPAGDRVYEVEIPLSISTVNSALAPFLFTYDGETQTVTVENTAGEPDKEGLRDKLLDSRLYDRNSRARLAESVLKAISEQISSDIPDEFRSAIEAIKRLGMTLENVDSLLRINPADVANYPSHLLFNVAENLKNTSWTDEQTFATYGTELLRNIVLSVCERKQSRLVDVLGEVPVDGEGNPTGDPAPVLGKKIMLRAGDEIVVYITYRGEVRVSPSRPLERFGRSQTELEAQSVDGRVLDLDSLAWVKLVLRAVV